MTVIANIHDLADLPAMLSGGFISARKHLTQPLIIYNYTARAQYDNVWNAATLACRGLIADEQGNIVARPFTKFFNLEQVTELPNEPFEVYEKLDGSLGITYWVGDQVFIATRGSFESEQAHEANRMLAERSHAKLDKRLTYLFEIIYPQNQIVVDYGGKRDLVLLAIIETATGRELPLADVGFPVVKRYDGITDVHSLSQLHEENAEGFVVRFASGLRVKVKMAEYVRLHRLLTGLSEKMIVQEFLMTGADLTPLLDRAPDEFNAWIRATVASYTTRYQTIESAAKTVFDGIKADNRKGYAQAFTKSSYAPILFKMLDGRPYDQLIWKMIEPQGATTFKRDEV